MLFDLLFRGSRKIINKLFGSGRQVKTIVLYPPIVNRKTFGEILNRVCWYLPESSEINPDIIVPVSERLLSDGIDVPSMSPPASQFNFLRPMNSLRFISNEEAKSLLKKADQILVWNKAFLSKPHILRRLHKARIGDPSYLDKVEMADFALLYESMMSKEIRQRYHELSVSNYKRLINESRQFKDAYLFMAGPSLERAYDFDFPSDSLRIICNTIPTDTRVVEHIKPQVYVFADPTLFGPSLFGAKVRSRMLEIVNKYGCYVIAPDIQIPLLMHHYPELANNIIGMPSLQGTRNWNCPSPERFYIKATGNIVTMYMLPVATAVADNIYILGADGMPPEGQMLPLAHSRFSYSDELLNSMSKIHPPPLRNISRAMVYKAHYKALEDFISFGESLGKKYHSLAESYIPAISKRYVDKQKTTQTPRS